MRASEMIQSSSRWNCLGSGRDYQLTGQDLANGIDRHSSSDRFVIVTHSFRKNNLTTILTGFLFLGLKVKEFYQFSADADKIQKNKE
jgi:hypothetical protein